MFKTACIRRDSVLLSLLNQSISEYGAIYRAHQLTTCKDDNNNNQDLVGLLQFVRKFQVQVGLHAIMSVVHEFDKL